MKAVTGVSRQSLVAVGASIFLLVSLFAAVGCGSDDDNGGSAGGSGDSGGGKIDLVAYSTPESVYQDVLEPAFEESPDGSGVSFSSSFGASGDQSRAVEAGQDASVVHFAQAGDMTRLVDAGIVAPDWDKNKYKGIAEDSVVSIVTRGGNPEGIQSFDDLIEKDISIVTPNPISSGGARWNIMAVYGNALHQGKSEDQALEDVKTVLSKAEVQPGSASDALAAFSQGQGDVLISYENEAIRAQNEGEDVDYVIPDSTILIEKPIAVTKEAPPAAQAFVDFLWSDEGQRLWAENGYRPVNQDLLDPKEYPTPKDLFTIAEFGGWDKVNDEFFDEASGKVAEIERELGVSTAG
jgi:sulfate/thiosulfate transport system substrate-binding protein